MKIKKSVTEKVIQANRENSEKSSGPVRTEYSSGNAVTHAVLCRKLRFENDEERSMFGKLVEELCVEHRPLSATEYTLVFELAFCTWNLQKLYSWLLREMTIAEGSAEAVLNNVAKNYGIEQLGVWNSERATTANRGWECQELVVRTANRTGEEEEFGSEDVSKKSEQVLVHATMTRTVDLILRYTAAVKRDYYRALSKLQELQTKRFELEELSN